MTVVLSFPVFFFFPTFIYSKVHAIVYYVDKSTCEKIEIEEKQNALSRSCKSLLLKRCGAVKVQKGNDIAESN